MRPFSANHTDHEFAEVLAQGIAHPQTLKETVLPFLQQNPDGYIPSLLEVFDTTEMAAKRSVADIFVGPLRDRAASILLPQLVIAKPDRFYWSAEVLGELQDERVIPSLIAGLAAGDKSVVLASVKGLAKFPREDTTQALIQFFLTCPDEVFLSMSLRFLVPLHQEMVPRLLPKYAGLDKFRRAWLLKYLALTGNPQAQDLFSSVLVRDPLDFGLFCIDGLGRIGSAAAIKILGETLKNPEWFVRKRVAVGLGLCASRESVPYLIQALEDESGQVRASAIESLSQVGKLDVPLLIKELGQARKRDTKVGLIRALGTIKDPQVVAPLLQTLNDRTTLFIALDVLGDLGFPQAAEALKPFLKDKEWFNRLNVLEALGKLNIPELKHLAEECREDSNDMVRNAAARILSRHAGETGKR